jgi:hypothetical protein
MERILVFAVKSTTLSSTVKVSERVDQAVMKLVRLIEFELSLN